MNSNSNLQILNVGLAIHNSDWNWKNIKSPFTRIYYVPEGTAHIVLSSGTYTLRPGFLYIIPALVKHGYICNSYFAHYYLHIYEESYTSYSFMDEWDFPVEIESNYIDIFLMKRLCEINPSKQLPSSDPESYDNDPTLKQRILQNKTQSLCDIIESRGIVYQLVSRFMKSGNLKTDIIDKRISDSVIYIKENIMKNIEISTLAEISCLSKDHFIRLFKKETGITPQQYINRKKIEKSQLILITSELSVKSIAYLLAFDDHSYFNRLFKKITGETPLQFRLNYK